MKRTFKEKMEAILFKEYDRKEGKRMVANALSWIIVILTIIYWLFGIET